MYTEDFSVDVILEAIDDMAPPERPKAILFDIGGVCVSEAYAPLSRLCR